MTEIPDFKKAQAKALELLDQFGYTTPPVDPVKIARDLGIRVFLPILKMKTIKFLVSSLLKKMKFMLTSMNILRDRPLR